MSVLACFRRCYEYDVVNKHTCYLQKYIPVRTSVCRYIQGPFGYSYLCRLMGNVNSTHSAKELAKRYFRSAGDKWGKQESYIAVPTYNISSVWVIT